VFLFDNDEHCWPCDIQHTCVLRSIITVHPLVDSLGTGKLNVDQFNEKISSIFAATIIISPLTLFFCFFMSRKKQII
jgi:hypothetical protein